MSRRRPAVREDGMPDWLAEYRPEQWAEDLEDPLEVYYFGRCRWTAARREWQEGGNPQPKIQNPQTRPEGQREHDPGPEVPPPGAPPQVHRARVEPRARPIKLH